jgi:hypothetical protein
MSGNNPTGAAGEPGPSDPKVVTTKSGKHISWDDARRAYRILVAAALGILATGTVVYHYLEDWSWVDSFYFSAVAVTTVGFGDLTPTTDGAKLFTVAYIFTGIAIITSYINVTLKRRGMKMANR